MIHFNLEEKLLIAGGCVTAVILFAIILACKVSPYCCLYHRCPLRAAYDELEEEGDGRRGRSRGKRNYRQINYASMGPIMPSMTLTSLEKANSATTLTLLGPTGAALPVYTATPNAGIIPCKIQHLRSHKESTSSVSEASTHSSDSGHTTPVYRSSGSSGVCSTFSSDDRDSPMTQPTSLNLSIQYNEKDEKLSIHVLSAFHIPTNIYGGANDSYLQILVVKDLKRRWGRKSTATIDELLQLAGANSSSSSEGSPRWSRATQHAPYQLAEYRTQLIRRKVDPIFNEHFVVNVKQRDKQHTCLKFILRSIDRFSHHSIVGTAHVGLQTFNGTKQQPEPVEVILQPYAPDLGQILLSLCYLPTAERLHVNIIKVNNLKPPTGLHTANPFVKAMVIRRGKVLEKHNTPIQFHTLNPVFNEPLIFDVPLSELERVTLLLTIVHQDTSDVAEIPVFEDATGRRGGSNGNCGDAISGRRSSSANGVGRKRGLSMGNFDDTTSEAHPSTSGASSLTMQKSRSIHSIRTKPYLPMGRITFGSLAAVKGSSKQHWQEMLQHPRKQVAQWHKLQP